MKSWRKRVLVEERTSAKALWWKELGIAEDQKVSEAAQGGGGSSMRSEAQGPRVQGCMAW